MTCPDGDRQRRVVDVPHHVMSSTFGDPVRVGPDFVAPVVVATEPVVVGRADPLGVFALASAGPQDAGRGVGDEQGRGYFRWWAASLLVGVLVMGCVAWLAALWMVHSEPRADRVVGRVGVTPVPMPTVVVETEVMPPPSAPVPGGVEVTAEGTLTIPFEGLGEGELWPWQELPWDHYREPHGGFSWDSEGFSGGAVDEPSDGGLATASGGRRGVFVGHRVADVVVGWSVGVECGVPQAS